MRRLALLALPLLIPITSSAQEGKGEQLFAVHEYAAAKAEFGASLRQNARDANALYYLGRIAVVEGRTGEAVDLLERAIRIDPAKADYHLWLGNALGMEAQRASKVRQPFLAKRVKSAFERTVELDPRSVAAREGLMQFYLVAPGVMGGSEAKAREQLAEIRRLNPMRGFFGDASFAGRARDTVAAERAFRSAIAAAPDSMIAYFALSSFYIRAGRADDALAILDNALARNPGELAVHYQIGRLGAVSGRHLQRAEASLERWIASPPRDATKSQRVGAHLRLGQVQQHMGRTDRARAEYQNALRIDPAHKEAKEALAKLR